MARVAASSAYVCQTCASVFPRWEGRCPACGTWNALVETIVSRNPGRRASPAGRGGMAADRHSIPLRIGQLGVDAPARARVGIGEVDRVLGGGLVPAELVLVGGEPGIGKSTLVLQIAAGVAGTAGGGSTVLYATAEESAAHLRMRAERLGLVPGDAGDALAVLAVTEVDEIVGAALSMAPALVIVDSIQTVGVAGLDGPAGSVGQVREAAARLGAFAREQAIPIVLVSHVTKDGSLAGPRTLEHLVDAVLMLEGDRHGPLRLLRALKNRHGSTDEIGVLEMAGTGLQPVADPARAFLGANALEAPGVVVGAVIEGSRPLLVEVQALVAPASLGPPRRTLAGIDSSRMALIIAVLARRAGVDVSGRDVYAVIAGGLDVTEPAVDLAVAIAVASSQRDVAVPNGTVAFGEISLLGEVRPVRAPDRRLREAARLGYRRVIVPASRSDNGPDHAGTSAASGLEVRAVRTLREALDVGLAGVTGTSG